MKILLVDDHAILRTGLKHILCDEFPNVITGETASAEETLIALQAQPWDVVLLDISLPGRSGLDILPFIHSQYPTTRVIVLSSFGDKQFAVRALRDGAHAFLTKEQAALELINAIRAVTQGRRYIASALAEQLADLMAGNASSNLHDTLSAREFEVFQMIARAKPPAQIARELDISTKTVSTYRTRILEKMGLSTNAEIMQHAIRHGLIR
jgi:DNA-binding NarL/FixJ family response regulator